MKTVVISLGGSTIVPFKIDIGFLKKFKALIEKFARKNYRFAIYCGGGKLARDYQAAAKKFKVSSADLDWIGTVATRLNAELIRSLLSRIAHPKVIYNPTEKIKLKEKVLVAAGWKPGWSTDYDAVLLAKNLGASSLINITNVEYVYDKNPKKYKNAKPIKEITWAKLIKITGKKFIPGLNMPFDPIAVKKAKKLGLKVSIIGKNLKNLENLLNNKPFKGTKIKS